MERSKFVAAVLAFTLSLCLVGSAFAEEPADQQTITSANGQMLNSHPQIPQNVLGPAVLWHLVVSNGYQGLSYGSWIDGVAASTPGTLTLSKSVTVSNSYTGTLTAKYDEVSAAVGFNITESHTTTASYSTTVGPGERKKIQYRPAYYQYKATQYTYSSDVGSTVLLGTDIIYPLEFAYLEYRAIDD